MRKSKKIKLDDKEIEVFELRVKDYVQVIDRVKEETNMTPAMFFDEFKGILPKCCTLTYEEMLEYAPSELEVIFGAFKECNESFFKLLGRMGLTNLPDVLSKAIEQDILSASTGSLPAATEE